MTSNPLAGYWRRYRRRYWVAAAVVVLGALVSGMQSGRFTGSAVVVATDVAAAVVGGLIVAAVIALAVALLPSRHTAGVGVRSAAPLAPAGRASERPWRPRLRSRHVKVLVLIVAFLAVAAGADMVQANREFAQLVDASHSYQDSEDEQNAWAVEHFPDEDALRDDPAASGSAYADGCAKIAGSLSSAEDAVKEVSILPWHPSLRAAKVAMVHYASARVDYFDACASAFSSPDASGAGAGLSRAEAEYGAAHARLPEAFANAEPLVTFPWWEDEAGSPFAG